MTSLEPWLRSTVIADIMHMAWSWPTAESLHFFGLSLLMGTVGLFDLRLLGFAKQIPLIALHRLIPFGVFGFAINVVTGISFLATETDQYLYNPSFQIKMLLIALAGINVMLFYSFMYRHVKTRQSGEDAPLPARIMGGASLAFWIGVMTCGRLITFFRPPYYWCWWC